MRRLLLCLLLLATGCSSSSTGLVRIAAAAPPPRPCPVRLDFGGAHDPFASAAGAGAARVCGFASFGPAQSRLATRIQLQVLVHELVRAPTRPPGTCACPADNGTYYVVELSFPGGGHREVYAPVTGCGSGGHVVQVLRAVVHS